jgi:hypothetical protein
MTNKEKSALIYCNMNNNCNNNLLIIEAMLSGMSLDDIIRNAKRIAPNLGYAGIRKAFYKYKSQVDMHL